MPNVVSFNSHDAKANTEDVVSLTQALIHIDSSNPGMEAGVGETNIASFVSNWFEQKGIESHWIEPVPGRPSVVAIVRGSGSGKSLMFNGHLDTVTLTTYDGDALSGDLRDCNIYGRGAADMKSGLAAAMMALAAAKETPMRGDVILTAVADEEMESFGTEQVLQAGFCADAAIVAEPTEMAIVNSHKGLAIFYVDIKGRAAHGSRPDIGIDAICKAGYFLVEIDRLSNCLQSQEGTKDRLRAPNIHAGIIKGGAEVSSYPASCTVSIERRTVAGETLESVQAELRQILDQLSSSVTDFTYHLRTSFFRAPFGISPSHPFVETVATHATKCMDSKPKIHAETYWTDMALLAEAGIPGVIWGPNGYGLHAKTEWVEVESLRNLSDAYREIVMDFCA
ncbi:putative metallopeptidase [Hortaea werneckii]|nr:putative metallopeptidase [Hortaea werneckii]